MNEEDYKGLTFAFGAALIFMQDGYKLMRKGWNGKGMWVEAQMPDKNSKMTRSYMFMSVPKGTSNQFGESAGGDVDRIPWLPSQTDMFSKDWEIVHAV